MAGEATFSHPFALLTRAASGEKIPKPNLLDAGTAPSACARAARALFATAPAPPAGAALSLFSYQICPFCHKAKAKKKRALAAVSDRRGESADQGADRLVEGVAQVPIAVFADGEVVNDSSAIVDAILAAAAARRRRAGGVRRRRAPLERVGDGRLRCTCT